MKRGRRQKNRFPAPQTFLDIKPRAFYDFICFHHHQRSSTNMHTDINRKSLIARFPEPLRSYAYLARLDRPVGIWLLLLPGWWAVLLAAGGAGAMNPDDWRLAGLFGLGAVIMRAAGCVVNDLWDRKLDQNVVRTADRPLAAGIIKPFSAIAFLALLLCGGLAILLRMPLVTVLLGVMVVPLIFLYPLMKRITWWPQAFLGLTFNFGALMGWSAVTGIVGLPSLLLYAGGIFWTLGYDTVYAHQDKEDDLRIGVKSSAIRLGRHSKKAVAGFYAVAGVLIVAAFLAAQAGPFSVALLVLPALQIIHAHKRWNPEDAASSLQAFRAARNTGFLVLLAVFFHG
ncbi:MAG: 4-hydroxybenzoate octaprenyltransferase [Alphaproteobacteria bacterium]|nr:4-hydroxybenzoate octaprenyltransferase [Alphaproteobacteria bacterium]